MSRSATAEGGPSHPRRPESESATAGFLVRTPTFDGSLAALAQALRSRQLLPSDIDLCGLVREYLAYYQRVAEADLNLATETLPQLARVIELKARLLLPKPPADNHETEAEEELADTLGAVALLEELEDAILFLKQRRDERRIVLPARTPRPDYPRPERPIKIGADRLAEMASRYRQGGYFELAVERLTMASAMKTLLASLRRVGRAMLHDLLPAPSWEAQVMGFAGMLELVREGKLRAHQNETYGPIELDLTAGQERDSQAA
ncbi:MAG TPA: ScpA family protein [Trueperaceae bacterium]